MKVTEGIARMFAHVNRTAWLWLFPENLLSDPGDLKQWRKEDVSRVALSTMLLTGASSLGLILLYCCVDLPLQTQWLPDVLLHRIGFSLLGIVVAIAARTPMFQTLQCYRAPLGIYGALVSIGLAVIMIHYPNSPVLMPAFIASVYTFALMAGPATTATYLVCILMLQHVILASHGGDPIALGSTEIVILGGTVTIRSLLNEPRIFLLRRTTEEVERLRTLRVVAEGVAHDILNPLNFIPSPAKLLLKNGKALGGVLSEGQRSSYLTQNDRLCKIILDATERAAEAIQAFRRCARGTDADEVMSSTDINEVAKSAASMLNADNIFSFDLLATSPCTLRRTNLQRVVLNLLINAQQACGESGKIEVRTYDDVGGVVLQIHDNGPGIPDDMLKRIFEPYFTTKPAGTGMGLAVAKTFAEAHGGWIKAENDHGAKFRLFMPLGATASSEKL